MYYLTGWVGSVNKLSQILFKGQRFLAPLVIGPILFMSASAFAAIGWPEVLSQSNVDDKLVLQIEVTNSNPQTDADQFVYELDNIDISDLVTRGENIIQYTSLQPLVGGEHLLKIYAISDDGSHTVVKQYTFMTESGAGGPGAGAGAFSFQSDNSLEISQTVFDVNIDSTVRDTTASGAGSLGVAYQNGRWAVELNGNYFLETESELSQTGNEFDLGEYTARLNYQAEAFSAEANLGHHDIGIESLAFSNFNRRGISLKTSIADDRLQLTGFSLSSDSVAGVDDVLGQKEDGGYVLGGAIVGRPFWEEDAKIELTGLYFTSKGGEADFGQGGGLGEDAAPKGSGGALIADTLWYADRLRVRGEYAFSDMDLDGDDLLTKEDARAGSFSLDYELIRDDGQAETPLSLKIGGKYEKIDTYFYSLANTGLAADRDGYSLFANMYWGSLSLNGYGSMVQNNTDDNPDIATDRVLTAGIDGSYSFQPQVTETGELGWMGTPYIGFGTNFVGADRDKTPAGYVGDDTDNQTANIYANLGTSYERWNWQAGYTHSFFEDDANVSSDTVNEMVDLSAYWNATDQITFSAGTQFNRYIEKTNSERSYNITGNFGAQAYIIPDTLNARLDYNMNLSSGSGDIPDRHLVTSEMEWTLIPAGTNSAGVAIAFRGAMEKEYGNSDNSLDEAAYEGFFVLKFKAPLAY